MSGNCSEQIGHPIVGGFLASVPVDSTINAQPLTLASQVLSTSLTRI